MTLSRFGCTTCVGIWWVCSSSFTQVHFHMEWTKVDLLCLGALRGPLIHLCFTPLSYSIRWEKLITTLRHLGYMCSKIWVPCIFPFIVWVHATLNIVVECHVVFYVSVVFLLMTLIVDKFTSIVIPNLQCCVCDID